MTGPELYLVASDGSTQPVEEDTLAASSQVAASLIKHDWVEMRREGVMPVTRWTVMQRNSSGCPMRVAVENWEGDTYMISSER